MESSSLWDRKWCHQLLPVDLGLDITSPASWPPHKAAPFMASTKADQKYTYHNTSTLCDTSFRTDSCFILSTKARQVRNATTFISERLTYIMLAISCSENVCARPCTYSYVRLERDSNTKIATYVMRRWRQFLEIDRNVIEKSWPEHNPRCIRLYDLLPIRSSRWRHFRRGWIYFLVLCLGNCRSTKL